MNTDNLVRAIAKTLVRQCKDCNGTGAVRTTFLVDGTFLERDCPYCADMRKALEEEA